MNLPHRIWGSFLGKHPVYNGMLSVKVSVWPLRDLLSDTEVLLSIQTNIFCKNQEFHE